MPVTLQGVPLTPPIDPGAITPYWHGQRLDEFDFPGYIPPVGIDHLAIRDTPRREGPRVGVLYWPTGASRWATCHLIATGTQLAAVRTAAGSTPGALTLQITDGINTITTSMWMLPPRPVVVKSADGSGDLYQITLVDERWWWWQAGNQEAPQNVTSWSGLLTSLFSAVGVTPTIDSISSSYSVPTAIRWDVGYKPLPLLIDAAASAVGRRVVRQLDGTVTVQSYTNAATSDETSWAALSQYVLSGGRMTAADIARSVPASVGVVFFGYDPAVVTKTLSSLALSEYSGLTPAAGKVAQVVADPAAIISSGTRDTYATQAATDYYLWALSRTEATFRGLQSRSLTGLDDFMEWVHHPQGVVTRVIRAPFSDRNLYGGTPPEVRFPALITSAYDATNGYSWSRDTLSLSVPGYITAVPSKTGNQLFEITGDRTIPVNTPVLMFSNPDGNGWEFQSPVRRETRCVDGVLKRQYSIDGGVTWITVENFGVPCVSGSGSSGSVSGSGGCPSATPIVIDVLCVGGITYVIRGVQSMTVVNGNWCLTLSDLTWSTAGCCSCTSGSSTSSGSGTGTGCNAESLDTLPSTLNYSITNPGGSTASCAIGSSGTLTRGGSTWNGGGYPLVPCVLFSTGFSFGCCDGVYCLSGGTACAVAEGDPQPAAVLVSVTPSPFSAVFLVPSCWFTGGAYNPADNVTVTISA